jgi:hypothetical protein
MPTKIRSTRLEADTRRPHSLLQADMYPAYVSLCRYQKRGVRNQPTFLIFYGHPCLRAFPVLVRSVRSPHRGGVAQLVERVLYHSTCSAVPERSWVQSLQLPSTEVEPGFSTFGGMLVPVLQLISPVCKTGTYLQVSSVRKVFNTSSLKGGNAPTGSEWVSTLLGGIIAT